MRTHRRGIGAIPNRAIVRTISCLVFVLLAISIFGLAQPQFPQLVGSVADSTGDLNVRDVQSAAERFAELTGGKPVALTITDKGGLSFNAYTEQFLERNGFGSVTDGTIDPAVFIITIDYEIREIGIFYGAMFNDELDGRINTLQDRFVTPYAGDDPTQAFVEGFNGIARAIVETNAPPPSTTVDTTGLGNALWKIVVLLVGLILIALFITKVWPEYKLRQGLVEDIKALRQTASRENAALTTRLGSNPNQIPSLARLNLVLGKERPQELESTLSEYNEMKARVLNAMNASVELEQESTSLLRSSSALLKLKNRYRDLKSARGVVSRWLSRLDARAREIDQIIDSTEQSLTSLIKRLSLIESRYQEMHEASVLLPNYHDASGAIKAEIELAQQKLNENRPFTAQSLARVIDKRIDALLVSSENLIELEKLSARSHEDAKSLVAQQSSRLPSADEIFVKVNESLSQLAAEISSGHYEDVVADIEMTTANLDKLLEILSHYLEVLSRSDQRIEQIKAHQSEGFIMDLEGAVEGINGAQASANEALIAGLLENAECEIEELDDHSENALEVIESIRSIHFENIERADQLAAELSNTKANGIPRVSALWEQLQTGYHPANWEDVRHHYDQALVLIDRFDHPEAGSGALIEQIIHLNGFKDWRCEEAEQLLTNAEVDLRKAQLLLDQLEGRHERVIEAEKSHIQILENAKTRLFNAIALRDRRDELIDSAVDGLIQSADGSVNSAEEALEFKIYIDVVGFAQKAIQLCDEAVAASEEQIAEISRLIEEKEHAKGAARQAVNQVQIQVDTASRVAVKPMTFNQLERANSEMQVAGRAEISALSLQDHAMKAQLEKSLKGYKRAIELAETV